MSFSSSNRALVVRFMLGMAFCVFFGVKGVINTPPLEKLEHYKGRLEWIKEGYVQPKDSSESIYGVLIKLREEENVFGTWVAKHKQAIVDNATKNSKVELWLGKMDGEIVQIKINNVFAVTYNRLDYLIVPFAFLFFGVLFLTMMIISIVKHPEIISARIAREKGVKF